jgi:hypothetical protein
MNNYFGNSKLLQGDAFDVRTLLSLNMSWTTYIVDISMAI